MKLKILTLLVICFSVFSVPAPKGREPFPPFVSGDGFRFYADHAYDELDVSLNPKKVKLKDVVFVKGAMLREFFEKVHPAIESPYILISHNSDDDAPGPFRCFLDDDRLIAWFALNYDGYPHPKMHPIPIGLANRCWPYGDIGALEQTIAKKSSKEHLLLMNFSIQTFSPERWGVFKLFAHLPFCYRTGKKPFEAYLSDAAATKFIISPRGFGLDTYRLWECLYLGAIPIVKSSSLDILYEGLPVLIIQNWEEVTEDFLKEKWAEMAGQMFSFEKLEMNFWIRLIETFKN